jgi:hypothetical protein
LGPAHRFRKIRGSNNVIRPAFPRGHRNNGHIEIENDPSDEEDEEEAFIEREQYGKITILPEQAIKLDFISQ